MKKVNKEIDIELEKFPSGIAEHLTKLADDDGMNRKKAREDLVDMGSTVVPFVHKVIESENEKLRWEGAKILEQIHDKRSVPVFIQLLRDEDSDIRWIAAQGLINIGKKSIYPILLQVRDHGDLLYIREGAHHVLWELFDEDQRERFGTLLASLDTEQITSETAPVEAAKILKFFNEDKNS